MNTEGLKKLLAEATNRPWKANTADKTGEDWLIASLGNSNEDGLDYIVTTDRVRASELDGDAKADAALIVAAVNALPGLLAEVEVLRRLAPEYFQWPGKSGADTAPEWLQDRLKYGSANVDGDVLAVYDWHGRRSLAAPGDYVVHGAND